MNVALTNKREATFTHMLKWQTSEEDTAGYFTDLRQIPLLSQDEAQALATRLRQVYRGELSQDVGEQARTRLIEGTLDLAVTLARKYRSSFRHFSFPDLIQEGNVALLEASFAFARLETGVDFRSYAAGAIRHAYLKALSRDRDVHITEYQYRHNPSARRLYSASLDQLYGEETDGYCLYDLLAGEVRLLPDEQTIAAKREQVEELLGQLTEKQQEVIRRKYGLHEQDGHMQQQTEIAGALGITPKAVRSVVHDALHRLRQDPEEARRRANRGANFQRNRTGAREIDEEDRAQLLSVYQYMQEEGQALNVRQLAKEARVDGQVAIQFLHEQIGSPTQRLVEAYQHLLTQSGPITLKRLARQAHCSDRAARSFLVSQGALLPHGRAKGVKDGHFSSTV